MSMPVIIMITAQILICSANWEGDVFIEVVYSDGESFRNWQDARLFCLHQHRDLIADEIRNREPMMKDLHCPGGAASWAKHIGVMKHLGEWRYVDGARRTLELPWDVGSPDTEERTVAALDTNSRDDMFCWRKISPSAGAPGCAMCGPPLQYKAVPLMSRKGYRYSTLLGVDCEEEDTVRKYTETESTACLLQCVLFSDCRAVAFTPTPTSPDDDKNCFLRINCTTFGHSEDTELLLLYKD